MSDVPALLELILRRLDDLALRVDELAVDVERPQTVIMTTMGQPDIIDLDDDALLPPVAPVGPRLVVDNGESDGPRAG